MEATEETTSTIEYDKSRLCVNNDELYQILVKVFNGEFDRVQSFLEDTHGAHLLSSNQFIDESNALMETLSKSCNSTVTFSYNVKTGMRIIVSRGKHVESFMLSDETLPTCLIKYNQEIGEYIRKYESLLNYDMYTGENNER